MRQIDTPFEVKEMSDTGVFTGLGSVFGNLDQGVNNVEELVLIVDRWFAPIIEVPSSFRHLMVPAIFARQKATGKRAPNQNANSLINADRYQLVFGVACLERIMNLLAHEARQAASLRDTERFHQVPPGII